MNDIPIKKIIAYDEKGNTFEKEICIRKEGEYMLFSFGWPEYNFYTLYSDLIEKPTTQTEFIIDIMGRNHRGSQVCVKISDVKECLKIAKQKLEEINAIIE